MYQKPEEYVREFIENILSSEELKGGQINKEVTAEDLRLYVDYRYGRILIETKAPGRIDLGRDQLKNYMKKFGYKFGLLIDIPTERYYKEYPKPYNGKVCYMLYVGVDLTRDLIYPVYDRCFERSEIEIARRELTALLKMITELNIASLTPRPETILYEIRNFVNKWENELMRIVKGTLERVKTYRSIWERNMELLYGKEVLKNLGNNLDKLFVELTIYVTVLKVLGATILESVMGGGRYTIPLRLIQEGNAAAVELFWHRRALARFNINFLFDRDEYDWIFSPEVAVNLDNFFKELGKLIAKFDWSQRIELDLLKRVYQHIVDPGLRKQLGEFYTPDWLAKLIVWRALHILVHGKPPEDVLTKNIDEEIVELIDEFYERNKKSGDKGVPIPRFVDPTCGSFTFGVQYLNALLEWYSRKNPDINPIKFVKILLENVVGIDLNPVAVITAKVNYLLQIHRLLMIKGEFLREEPMIPIFRVDLATLHTMYNISKSKAVTLDQWFELRKDDAHLNIPLSSIALSEDQIETLIKTLEKEGLNTKEIVIQVNGKKVMVLRIPRSLIDKIKSNRILAHRALIALAFGGIEGFENEIEKAGINLDNYEKETLKKIVKIINVLEKQKLDHIWYSILANHILVYIESIKGFDLVLGNLPWVNVSKYPESYRDRLREIAKELGVNPPKEAAKKLDISVILFAISSKYLLRRDRGVVGLMVPKSILRGLHGSGWRSFLVDNGFEIHEVFDLEDVKPFETAQNQPSIVLVRKLKS